MAAHSRPQAETQIGFRTEPLAVPPDAGPVRLVVRETERTPPATAPEPDGSPAARLLERTVFADIVPL
ncbi:hypothetical protein ACIBAG_38875 [Streptomyces sp. NPDC051243]|uniref:hypothetical protein n=1 Tax=Streptomyces sp. NPDC051243 TaxID=3365646 RepID=UPI0037B36473